MAFSSGLTGKVTTLLAQAAELAIRLKTESITLDLIEQAGTGGCFKLPVEKSEIETI